MIKTGNARRWSMGEHQVRPYGNARRWSMGEHQVRPYVSACCSMTDGGCQNPLRLMATRNGNLTKRPPAVCAIFAAACEHDMTGTLAPTLIASQRATLI